MASLKKLKKNINRLCYEVVSDCFTYILVNEDKNKDSVVKIISETIQTRNELISRLNKPSEEVDPAKMKKHYRSVKDDLIKGMDQSLNKLSKLSAKK